MFAVIYHPATGGRGTCHADALETHRRNGWVRVSQWRSRPDDFHLPEFVDAVADLDPPLEGEGEPQSAPAPDPEPEAKPAKATKSKES